MAKYTDSDNGTVVDGRQLVFLRSEGPAGGPGSKKSGVASKGGASSGSGNSGGSADGDGSGAGEKGGANRSAHGQAGKAGGAGGKSGAGQSGAGGAGGANNASGAGAVGAAGNASAKGKSGAEKDATGTKTATNEDAPKKTEDGKEITRSVRAQMGSWNFDKSRTFPKKSAFDVLRPVLDYCKKHVADADAYKLLVVGHADSTGKQTPNQVLSAARANAVVALLQQNPDGWMDNWIKPSSSTKWDSHEEQQMLDAVFAEKQPDDLRAALLPYKGNPNKKMPDADRYKLVRAYMRLAGEKVDIRLEGERADGAFLITTLGCGEWHPKDRANPTDAINRRIDVFIFQSTQINPSPDVCRQAKGKEMEARSTWVHCKAYDQWQSETKELAAEPFPQPPDSPDNWFIPIRERIAQFEKIDEAAFRKHPYWLPDPADGNEVTPLIGGRATFQAMLKDMESACEPGEGHFIYIANWWVNYDFGLDTEGGKTLREVLLEANKNDCLIRALFWDRTRPQQSSQNRVEVEFVNKLDNGHAILDGRHHLAGTHHQKILCINSKDGLVCYFGGVDFNYDRIYEPGQEDKTLRDSNDEFNSKLPRFPIKSDSWSAGSPLLDLHCRVRGPAAYDVLEVFLKRYSDHPHSTAEYSSGKKKRAGQILIPQRPEPLPLLNTMVRTGATFGNQPNAIDSRGFSPGDELVQLIEAGSSNGVTSVEIKGTFESPDAGTEKGAGSSLQQWRYSFAPEGRQSGRAQLLWAISSARDFIYFEDQYMVNEEIALALNAALKRGVRFIIGVIPHQLISTDFTHFGTEPLPPVRKSLFIEKVIEGIPNPDLRFQLFSPKRKPGWKGSVFQYVHSKVWIFDDRFCTIGSMNINYRGTTHDSELAVGIYQPGTKENPDCFARRLRIALWQRLLLAKEEEIIDLDKALEYWGRAARCEIVGQVNASLYDWRSDRAFDPGITHTDVAALNEVIDPRIDLPAKYKAIDLYNNSSRLVFFDVDNKVLRLKQPILFQPELAELDPSSSILLDEIANTLAAHPEARNLAIEVHSDDSKVDVISESLTRRRAEAIQKALQSRNVDPARMTATGFGARRPLKSNSTAEGRTANNRIELKLTLDAAAKTESKIDLQGTLKGPAGPMKKWPFLLKKNGAPAGKESLGGGSTKNEFKNGRWLSDAQGIYTFEGLPKAEYTFELVMPGGKIVLAKNDPPMVRGARIAAPAPLVEDHDYLQSGIPGPDDSSEAEA